MKKEKEIKVDKEIKENKKVEEVIKPLVTARILFSSVLEYIYLGILELIFITMTYVNFKGDMSRVSYNFFDRVGNELLIIIVTVILYFVFNWVYKCVIKTMLTVCENEVYIEKYLPLKKSEISIPLNKITGIKSYTFFYIFRSVTIFQYGKLPIIFFTWNNKEVKDKLTELIMKDKLKVENIYEDKNMLNKDKLIYILYSLIVLAIIILLLGIIRFFYYINCDEKKLVGTYKDTEKQLVIKKDGSCDVTSFVDNMISCNWTYNDLDKQINVRYEYKYTYSNYTYTNSLFLNFDKSKKTLMNEKYNFSK